MCITCHKGLSDEVYLSKLKETLINPQFSVWNTTSLSHLAIGVVGYNGLECRNLAHQLMTNYIQWKFLNKTTQDGLFFGNPTIQYVHDLKQLADKVYYEQIENKSLGKEEIMQIWTNEFETFNKNRPSDILIPLEKEASPTLTTSCVIL
jgi:hypothetical protein